MRIRVDINPLQPLMRGLNLKLENGRVKWIDFRYEKLPYFCYNCGLIGHRYRDCEILLVANETDSDSGLIPNA